MLLGDDLTRFTPRDLSQTLFFKVASRTFGPPRSRTRRIIAPLMEKLKSEEPVLGTRHTGAFSHHDQSNLIQQSDLDPSCANWIQQSDLDPSCANWIVERKRLQAQIDSMGNVTKWLQGKSFLTESEVNVQEAMSEERRKSQKSNITSHDPEAECSVRKTSRSHLPKPSIHQPSPNALGILDSYLHQRRLRLVDLYNQADKRKRRNLTIKDLKAVRNEARMPVTDLQIENLVISLSNKTANRIMYKELSIGRSTWRKENIEEHHRNVTSKSVGYLSSPEDQSLEDSGVLTKKTVIRSESREDTGTETSLSYGRQSASSKSKFLQLPPADLGEMRPLSYEDMEEIGKSYRERKRRAKSNTRLLDWLEQCRVVRTGNAAIDAHSLPSTAGDEIGDLVEQHRRQRLQEYHHILHLCQLYNVSLSEKLLQRALLFPGDTLVSASRRHLMIRQPGRNTFSKKDLLDSEHAEQKVSLRHLEMCSKLHQGASCASSQTLYPSQSYVRRVRAKVRGKLKDEQETLSCWVTFEQFQQMICNLKRRFPYCFRIPEDNAFWPGHLLEKLCVYLPCASQRSQSVGGRMQS